MTRHLRFIALCAGVLATAGCTPTKPSPPPPGPEPPSAPQRLAALALFESALVHAQVTTIPVNVYEGRVWLTDGPCVYDSGSVRASLDGGLPPTPGTSLPTGSHTYVVSFSDCQVSDWPSESRLNGVVSAAYSTADWTNITATVSADSVRGQRLAVFSELQDVTADGSAAWTNVRGSYSQWSYTPATGSRLVNNSSANVATFGGGSYWDISDIRPQGLRTTREQRFDHLKVAINGTEYTLNGSLHTAYDFSGRVIYTGEIRIINHKGTLVARIYGVGGSDRMIEVREALVPF